MSETSLSELPEGQRAARADAALRHLQAIQSVTDLALADLSLDEFLREILSRVRRELATDSATLLLTTPDGTGLVVRASDGLPGPTPDAVPLGRGVAGRIALRDAPLAIEDLGANDVARDVLRLSLRSLLGTPLLVQGKRIGVLHVGTFERRSFSPEQTHLLELAAFRIARVVERARLTAELEANRSRLEALSRRLLDVQEEERRRIAKELHDEVGQLLTGLKFQLAAQRHAPGRPDLCHLVDEVLARVRDLSMTLLPPMLEDLGLLHALLWQVERYTAQTGVEVDFRHSGLGRRFGPEFELATFRIAQEALTNVARHADVGRARLEVWASEDAIGVEVSDAGRGYDPDTATGPSVGVAGMRERARLLGGRLTVESSPGRGTRLSAVLPLRPGHPGVMPSSGSCSPKTTASSARGCAHSSNRSPTSRSSARRRTGSRRST